jgi:hypothetical protein
MQWSGAVRASIVVGLCLGCSRAAGPPVASKPAPLTPEYVTITPDVSVSRNAQPAEPKSAALDPRADVMAEILALPAGR